MLDVDNATPFLLERGMIDVGAILDGELMIAAAARRNRNLRVHAGDGAGYLLKQPYEPAEGGRATLRAEAAFYEFCTIASSVAPVLEILPRVARWEPSEALLALELLADAQPLDAYLLAQGPPGLPPEAHRALGCALGTLHRLFRGPVAAKDSRLAWLPTGLPWVLRIHRPSPELLASISPSNVQTLRILQNQPGLAAALDALRRQWHTGSVIHNDLKSDNILVCFETGAGGVEVRLVDWEFVQIGDPAWDLAGALQDALIFWVRTMTLSADSTPEEIMASALYALGSVQVVLRALWAGYRETAGLASESEVLLARAVAFSPARLIQTAYEAANGMPALPSVSVILLQIAANILADPELAQVKLYGLHGGATQ
jgi:hypothetical protein